MAEPAACWGKARPLQPPAQPYARECHTLVDLATQTKGDELRSAALAFYSQVQHERHVTGRSTRMPNPQPEYLVEPEHAHLLATFANPNPL